MKKNVCSKCNNCIGYIHKKVYKVEYRVRQVNVIQLINHRSNNSR